MVSLAEQKYRLFQLITSIDNPSVLQWLEQELKKLQKEETPAAPVVQNHANSSYQVLRSKLNKPFREKLDVEAIKKEQGWKGQHDKAEMMRLIREMEIREPVEQLLAQLTP